MFEPNFDDSHSMPPTEAEWEVMLRRSDARSAKYAELLETLIDHPDRDAIIDQEMGWNEDSDNEPLSDMFDEIIEQAHHEVLEAGESESSDAADEEDVFDLAESPLYHKAFDWGLRLHTELQLHLPEVGEIDPEEPLYKAFCECLVVAGKLAGCQAMCDDEQSLGGGIVYTKRALKAAQATLTALEELQQDPTHAVTNLVGWIEETRDVCTSISHQIEELRSRMWWE